MIWGSVISLGGKGAMRLYWTHSREVAGVASSGKYQPQTETIALPTQFWSDLKQILGLLTQSRLAELTFGQEGHYVADRLAPLITQVRKLVQSKEGVWNPETLAGVQVSLATALGNMASSPERANRSSKASNFFAKSWTNGPASACRSIGPKRRTISAMR